MPQSLSKVIVHLTFSTKNRERLIGEVIRPRLHAYLAKTMAGLGCSSLRTGGVDDHIHSLLVLNRTISQAELVEQVKTSSSKWMKLEGGVRTFGWQTGYGAFSVGQSQAEAVMRYIENQEKHHRQVSFQEEFRKFLVRYHIPYDERYVWD